jgi:hypothetical protein
LQLSLVKLAAADDDFGPSTGFETNRFKERVGVAPFAKIIPPDRRQAGKQIPGRLRHLTTYRLIWQTYRLIIGAFGCRRGLGFEHHWPLFLLDKFMERINKLCS